MKDIKVKIKQENIQYKIIFSDDFISSLKSEIKDFEKKKFLFVVDSRVYELYKSQFFEKIDRNIEIFVIPNWEQNKNIKTVFMILDKLMEISFTRKDYLVSIWWWVTWDICWFASSLFKRWINFIQIPTTLLSMFDSSVWWKTWVDYQEVKNGIWTFYNPKLVIVDINFLKTLAEKELISGYFEWLKHALLLGKNDYKEFKDNYEKIIKKDFDKEIEKIVAKNIKCKLNVVKSDPTETIWKRRVLNYGHTFWHALETYLNFELWHWICVAYGIIFANLLSLNIWILDKKIFENIENFIKSKIKDIKIEKLDFDKIFSYMKNDKKNETSEVNFILLMDYWEVFQEKISEKKLKEVFDLFILKI